VPHENETGLKGRKRPYTLHVICALSVKGCNLSDIRWEVFLKLNKVTEQYSQNNWA